MDTQQISAPPRASSRVPARVTAFGVVHVHAIHTERFTIVGNHLAQHGQLSLTAIGLAVHILSLPDGAKVGVKVLADRFPESEARIAAALRELETHRYLRRFLDRLPSGKVVTRTVCYARPEAVQDAAAPVPRREAGAAPPAVTPEGPEPARGREALGPAPTPEPVVPVPEPVVPVPEPVDPAPEPVLPVPEPVVPTPPPTPEPPGPVAPVRGTPTVAPAAPPPARLPEPAVHDPDRHRIAVDLLAGLRRDDIRLLLSEHEVRRLAPAVSAWLEREVHPDAVRLALTSGLPGPLRRPSGLLAHRLAALLPPPLPAPAPRPRAMRTCDGCERGIRAPEGELCRDCRSERAAAA